jgi:hypothetical protein
VRDDGTNSWPRNQYGRCSGPELKERVTGALVAVNSIRDMASGVRRLWTFHEVVCIKASDRFIGQREDADG